MIGIKQVGQIAALGLIAVAAAGCGSGGSSESGGSITYVGYGGETQTGQATAWQKPFTKETGIKFQNDTPPEIAKIKAMVDSGNVSWDVVGGAAAEAKKYCGTLFESLKDVDIDPGVFKDVSQEELGDCALPVFYAPSVPYYNTKQFSADPPTSLKDVFDTKKYPGKRVFLPFITAGTLEEALLGDGVKPEDLYPLDVDRALKKLDELGDDAVIPANYGELQQAMAGGKVAFVFSTPSRASFTIEDGAPYAPIWDQTVSSVSVVSIPKGSKNLEAAKKWLAFVSKAEPQAKAGELTTLPPANLDSKPKYNKIQTLVDAYSPEHRDSLVYMDIGWWAKNQEAVQKRFTEWQVR